MNAGAAAAAAAAAAGGGATAAIHIKAILSPPRIASQPALTSFPYSLFSPPPMITSHPHPHNTIPPSFHRRPTPPHPRPHQYQYQVIKALSDRAGKRNSSNSIGGAGAKAGGGLMVIPYRDSVLTFLLKGTSHELRAEKKPKLAR